MLWTCPLIRKIRCTLVGLVRALFSKHEFVIVLKSVESISGKVLFHHFRGVQINQKSNFGKSSNKDSFFEIEPNLDFDELMVIWKCLDSSELAV